MTQPTNYEISRRLDEIGHNVRDGFDKVHNRLDRYVLSEVHAAHSVGVERRLSAIEERLERAEDNRAANIRWAITTVIACVSLIGMIVFGVLAVIL